MNRPLKILGARLARPHYPPAPFLVRRCAPHLTENRLAKTDHAVSWRQWAAAARGGEFVRDGDESVRELR